MSLIKCPKCGKENNDNIKFCPECGAHLEHESSKPENNPESESYNEQIKHERNELSAIHSYYKRAEAGEITSSAPNPKNKKIIIGIAVAIIVIILLFITKIICIHDWTDATCTDPQMCSKCDKIKGEALEHEWMDATCTAPETCSICGETQGEALEHIPGESKFITYNFVLASETRDQHCEICGETYDIVDVPLDSLYKDNRFLFTVDEFVDRLNYIFVDEYELSDCEASVTRENGSLAVEITRYSESVFVFFMEDDETMIESTDTATINNIIVVAEDTYTEAIYGWMGVIMTCDPSVTNSESVEILTEALNTAITPAIDTYDNNGITYSAAETEGLMMFGIRLD